MKRFWKPVRAAAVAVVALILPAYAARPAAAVAMDEGALIVRETATGTVDDKGDSTYSGRIAFPTQAIYLRIKNAYPNPFLFFREVLGSGGKFSLTNVTASYDDANRCIAFSATQLGAAVMHHHRWQVDMDKGSELLDVNGRTAVVLNVHPMSGLTLILTSRMDLPAGSAGVKVDPETGTLSYLLDRQPKAGLADLDVDVKVKPRLMSAVYKVYADPEFADGKYWTSKTLFTNNGTGDITNLRISYRLGNYTQDWSPASEYALLAPGGHVVDLFYPLLKADVAAFKSQVPVNLDVKYSYTDASGKAVEEQTSKRLTLLGVNQFEFANVPEDEQVGTWLDANGNNQLEAAFVTKLDESVRGLGGLASQASGGVAAGADDKQCRLFCKALYDLEVSNGLTYQTPAGDTVGQGAFAQSLKYPRDCIRDKAGTCIELAILYAAVCESQGLSCELVNIPGHCFPVVRLPSGDLLPVESTCIAGGAGGRPATFEEAVHVGVNEYIKKREEGPSIVIDVDQMQGRGVVCPELPALPTSVMQDWGWKLSARNGDNNGPVYVNNDNNPNPPQVADASHPDALVGTWTCQYTGQDGNAYTKVDQISKNGTWTCTDSGNGASSTDHGTWMVDPNRNVISRSEVTGHSELFQVSVEGDVLTFYSPRTGVSLRMSRSRT